VPQLQSLGGELFGPSRYHARDHHAHVRALRLPANLFFGNAAGFRQRLNALVDDDVRAACVIVDAKVCTCGCVFVLGGGAGKCGGSCVRLHKPVHTSLP
jgi:hypothetical protein